mgnify:CR=1 FL=1
MAEIATIARPYAEAAFELADQAGALAAWSGALANLAAAAREPSVQELLGNPLVTTRQLVDMLGSVAAIDTLYIRLVL